MKSINKGVLIPGMNRAQRDAISHLAARRVIYQTGGVAGFYFNAGIPGIPQWELIGENLLPSSAKILNEPKSNVLLQNAALFSADGSIPFIHEKAGVK